MKTPAQQDIVTPDGQNRRFTSFFISDILDDGAVGNASNELGVEIDIEPELLESTQGKAVEQFSRDREKQEPLDEDNASPRTKPSSKQQISSFKSRSPFLPKQRNALEEIFQESKYISSCKRKELALELRLSERQIKTWFQNRRTKFRKIRGSDGLRRQDTWSAERGDTPRVLSNVDGGINGLPKDLVRTLYKLLTER